MILLGEAERKELKRDRERQEGESEGMSRQRNKSQGEEIHIFPKHLLRMMHYYLGHNESF